ncbi:unnamed protein product [Orchesella dallaii]|uniref:Uncharacterized protein n=1 Tax=Orchesella dallaii TaxID=48710 RepID=A0ABP1QJ57_9HEXA
MHVVCMAYIYLHTQKICTTFHSFSINFSSFLKPSCCHVFYAHLDESISQIHFPTCTTTLSHHPSQLTHDGGGGGDEIIGEECSSSLSSLVSTSFQTGFL